MSVEVKKSRNIYMYLAIITVVIIAACAVILYIRDPDGTLGILNDPFENAIAIAFISAAGLCIIFFILAIIKSIRSHIDVTYRRAINITGLLWLLPLSGLGISIGIKIPDILEETLTGLQTLTGFIIPISAVSVVTSLIL